MKIIYEKEEVHAIVMDHVRSEFPAVVEGKELRISGGGGYSDWEIHIEDPEEESA